MLILAICTVLISAWDLLEDYSKQQATNPSHNGGEVMTVSGTVVDMVGDCAFDGICSYIVESDSGQYEVIWAEGMMQCLGGFT